jgi:hypothetical protein
MVAPVAAAAQDLRRKAVLVVLADTGSQSQFIIVVD